MRADYIPASRMFHDYKSYSGRGWRVSKLGRFCGVGEGGEAALDRRRTLQLSLIAVSHLMICFTCTFSGKVGELSSVEAEL